MRIRLQQGFLNRIKDWLRPPAFEDVDKTRRAKNLNTVLLSLLLVFAIYIIYPITSQQIEPAITAILVFAILVGMLVMLRKGYVQQIAILLTTAIWLAIIVAMGVYGGVRNSGFATIIIAVFIAYLTMGIRSGIVFSVLSILSAIGLGIAEYRGLLPPYAYETITTIVVSHSLVLIVASLLLYLTIWDFLVTTQTTIRNEQATKEAYKVLDADRATLEVRTQTLERRNLALQTITEIAQLSSSIQDEKAFLDHVAQIVGDKFAFEHVGIYIIDDREEYLVLRAANDEAGKDLIYNQHSLPVTSGEFLYELSTEINWLNYQIGDNRYHVFSPILLADTQTTHSFPLTARSRLVGLLNMQTRSTYQLGEEQEVLQTLANQVAISLENLRLLARLQEQVREINILTGKTIQDAWREVRGDQPLGFQYDRLQILPASELFPARIANQLRSGQSVHYTHRGRNPFARLLAPIVIRGETIGVIGYEEGPEHQWQADEIAVLETIASRVGLAIENARLLNKAQLRADREQKVATAASRIRETLDLETVLRTAAQEFKQAFSLTQAEVRLTEPIQDKSGKAVPQG